MNNLIGQIVFILTNPPGNLLYHLVLIFSIALLLQAALGISKAVQPGKNKRVLSGGLLLLLFQIILFLNSSFAWQGLNDAQHYLPSVDRGVTALSFIWILWMWIYPNGSRSADRITLVLSIVIIALLIFSVTAWQGTSVSTAFNSTLLDWSWSVLYAALLISGILLLLMQKPAGWGLALLFLNINLAGNLAHMLWASPTGDLSAALRISQLFSFPLLPGMVFALFGESVKEEHTTLLRDTTSEEKKKSAWLDIYLDDNFENFIYSLTRSITTEMHACCCLWLEHMGDNRFDVSGFNQKKEQPVRRTTIDIKNLRALNKAFSKTQITLLESNPLTMDEFVEFTKVLPDIKEIEQLYIFPIWTEAKLLGSLLLAYPQAGENQSTHLASSLKQIKNLIISMLNQKETLERLQGKNEAQEREISAAQYQLVRQQAEIETLRRQMDEINAVVTDQESSEAQTEKAGTDEDRLQGVVEPHPEYLAKRTDQKYPLYKSIDQVIDKVSFQLLEQNITLKLSIPEDLGQTPIAEDIGQDLEKVLEQSFSYISAISSENDSLNFEVLSKKTTGNALQIKLSTKIKPTMNNEDGFETNSFREMSRMIERITGISIQRVFRGNMLDLVIVLPV